MQRMLTEIARSLEESDLTIEQYDCPGNSDGLIWHISDTAQETIIRVMILPGGNGYPEFWCPAFAGYAAKYIVPIVTRLGDARDRAITRDGEYFASRNRRSRANVDTE